MLSDIRIGLADADTGLDVPSLSITADVEIAGRKPGAELVKLGSFVLDGIFAIPFSKPVTQMGAAHLTIKVRDKQGNLTTTTVRFWVGDLPRATSVANR